MRALGKVIAVVVAGAPAAALAHTGHPESWGLLAGLVHPLGGLDHLLAMVAVGVWAAQAGGRALWAVPAAFLGAMAVGGLAGAAGVAVPGGELGIAGSVVAFGLLVALARRLPLAIGLALTGTFAVFHGQAHVAEMGAGGALMPYAAGFLSATAALHVVGAGLGQLAGHAKGAPLLRAAGALTGAAGGAMLAGLA